MSALPQAVRAEATCWIDKSINECRALQKQQAALAASSTGYTSASLGTKKTIAVICAGA